MEGTLVKRAMKSGRNWKKRYFVLDDQKSTLYYYKKRGGQLRGEIRLTQNSIVRKSSVRPNAFELQVPQKAALFAFAATDRERQSWDKALKMVIASMQTGGKSGMAGEAKVAIASSGTETGGAGARSPEAFEDFHSFSVSGTEFNVTTNYKLIKLIGHGAYGVVISALDKKTNRKVAIKKVTQAFEDLVDAKRILRELALLRHFDHDNVVSVCDIVKPESFQAMEDVYIVSDLMETDLHRVIYSRQKLTDEHVQYFLYQLLRGLKYLHTGNVMHRDLKPSNLLVNSNCDLKICDFGLSRGLDQEDAQQHEDMTEYVVTRWYRAPEIMLAVRGYGPAIDMWSVGCIFAELMVRKPLFPGNDYIHQLKIICDCIGSPSTEELAFIKSEKALRFMKHMRKRKKRSWGTVFPNYENPGAFDLLERMLKFDPGQRISVVQALAHPYLKSLHLDDDEPSCERPFTFAFRHDDLTKEKLQELMYEHARAFHPDRSKR